MIRSIGALLTRQEGEQLLLAILAASETMIRNRKSFLELTADFSPIGQFGAAHGR